MQGLTRILTDTVPVTLVEDITFSVDRGEFVAVTGPSGSGKSSLLYLLGLLDHPTRGFVELDSVRAENLPEKTLAQLRLEKIGFVFQFHFLLAEFTALQNVTLPMRRLGRLSKKEAAERGEALLDSLGLADHRHKTPDKLSGGQRQRVAVARALANDPPLILADEPTGNLDTKSTANVIDILKDLAQNQKKTIIAVTHDPVFASYASRVIHIVDARIAEGGDHGPAAAR